MALKWAPGVWGQKFLKKGVLLFFGTFVGLAHHSQSTRAQGLLNPKVSFFVPSRSYVNNAFVSTSRDFTASYGQFILVPNRTPNSTAYYHGES